MKKKTFFFAESIPFFPASVETATTSGFFSASTGGEDPATSWRLDDNWPMTWIARAFFWLLLLSQNPLIWLQGFVETEWRFGDHFH